jgi:hypothetical protein
MDRRQRRVEEKRKKRTAVKQRQVSRASGSRAERRTRLMEQVATLPIWKCLVAPPGWDTVGDNVDPQVVQVVAAREFPDGKIIACMALLDRTSVGVKMYHLGEPMTKEEYQEILTRTGEHGIPLVPIDTLVVQSMLYHAIDYARSLGFPGHSPSFPEPMFGPRPAQLLDTPWAKPSMPIYIASADLDEPIGDIMEHLNQRVGEDGYRVIWDGFEEMDMADLDLNLPEGYADGPDTEEEIERIVALSMQPKKT